MTGYRYLMIAAPLAVVAFVAETAWAENRPMGKASREPRNIRGKSIDAWIAQAKSARKLNDRHNALQVLRNDGIRHDRKKTLRAFTELLTGQELSVQGLAVAGLHKAGRPTDTKAPPQLAKIILKYIDTAKLTDARKPLEQFGLLTRTIRALGVIGGKEQLDALRRVTMHKTAHVALRRLAEAAIRAIQKREQKPGT